MTQLEASMDDWIGQARDELAPEVRADLSQQADILKRSYADLDFEPSSVPIGLVGRVIERPSPDSRALHAQEPCSQRFCYLQNKYTIQHPVRGGLRRAFCSSACCRAKL